MDLALDFDDVDFSVARVLYTRSFLDAAAECGVEVSTQLASLRRDHAPEVFIYPDGAVELKGKRALEMFERGIGNHVRQRAKDMTVAAERAQGRPLHLLMMGHNLFQALWCFQPRRLYTLWFWGDFVEKLPDGHFGVYAAMDPFGAPDPDSAVDNLPVTIGFKEPLDEILAKQLAELVVCWAGGAGISGEGPARLVSSEINVTDRTAQFRIDLSTSEQKTVNWLILQLLHLPGSNPVVDIHFVSLTLEQQLKLLERKATRYSVEFSA